MGSFEASSDVLSLWKGKKGLFRPQRLPLAQRVGKRETIDSTANPKGERKKGDGAHLQLLFSFKNFSKMKRRERKRAGEKEQRRWPPWPAS